MDEELEKSNWLEESPFEYKGTIDLDNRKVLREGNVFKTENSITITLPNKQFVVIPTVIGGKQFSDDEAITHFYKTKEHLGIYDDLKEADKAAYTIHTIQEKKYKGN